MAGKLEVGMKKWLKLIEAMRWKMILRKIRMIMRLTLFKTSRN